MKLNVPGIDDADFNFTITSRDGNRSAYIRVHKQPDNKWAYAITIDDDRAHFCQDLGEPVGGFDSAQRALFTAWHPAVDSFAGEPFVYDSEMRLYARRYRSAINAHRKA